MAVNNDKRQCPVDHARFAKVAGAANSSACPVPHGSDARVPDGHPVVAGQLNPLNNIPFGINDASGSERLSTEREISSIPRGDESGANWDYPSPQAFYNALKRKGWETNEGDVPTMVAIHNFLNEACWGEILKWENKYHCDCKDIKLARFQGRPSDLSPKARWMGIVHGADKPFDRHDWTVNRCGKDVRYVIDYYSGHDEPDNPVFNVDVRPALDSPSSVFDRLKNFGSTQWEKYFGTN
ncbi:holocytochrome c synthase [Physocladia obscura]|uniref:Holocytochrome c-type synthase n=1 Tax=Physocladia obscura TaxID=109957 RepID=A0AAD5T625_9FUNG|nr:holocytochrome c synthase [Physocladia obscura]